MKKNVLTYILIILFLIYININYLYGKKFGPWDTKLGKVEQKKSSKIKKIPSTGSWFFNRFIRFFQIYISPQDGPNCRYRPTCSKYGEICINHYGPFIGVIMTADRFMRCNPFGVWGIDLPEDNYFWDKNKENK